MQWLTTIKRIMAYFRYKFLGGKQEMNDINMNIFSEEETKYENMIREITQKLSARVEEIKITVLQEKQQEVIEREVDLAVESINKIEDSYKQDCQLAFEKEQKKLDIKPQPKTQSEQLNSAIQDLLKLQRDKIEFSLLTDNELLDLARVEQSENRLHHIKSTLLDRAKQLDEKDGQALKMEALSITGDTPKSRVDKLQLMLNDIQRQEQLPGVPFGLKLSVAGAGNMKNYLLKNLSVEAKKAKGVE